MQVAWNTGVEAAIHNRIKRFLTPSDQGRVMGAIRETFGVARHDQQERGMDAFIRAAQKEFPDKSADELRTIMQRIQRQL